MQLNFPWEVFLERKPCIYSLIFIQMMGEEDDWLEHEEAAEIGEEAEYAWPAKQQ